MTKKKIYLHIGFGKTGTSAVQEFFFHNRESFARQGLGYPSAGLSPYAHHGLASFEEQDMSHKVVGFYRDLVSEVDASSARNFLVTSENFCFLSPAYIAKVKQYLSHFDVKIIFYVRNQVSLVESTYLEWQKSGQNYRGSIGNFFTEMQEGFDFELRVASWMQEFGLDNIVVRVYDRRIIGDDTSTDMMNLLGLTRTADVQHTNLRTNPSLLPEFSLLVSQVDEAGIQPSPRKAMISELLRLSNKLKRHATDSLVNEELRVKIFERYRDSNARFASKHLSSTDASIFLGG